MGDESSVIFRKEMSCMSDFILSCESTVDLPFSYVNGRNIPVLFYSYQIDGVEYTDDMLRDKTALPQFYKFLDDGKMPTTSQLNEFSYIEFFGKLLEKGDVLHIAFGSGMTQSVQNAKIAAEELRKRYPERKLIVVDSYCSSSGYGLLVDYAADLRDEGKSIESVAAWATAHAKFIHHQFYSTRLDFYRRSGRMSGPTAMIATVLNICPIMRLDDVGKIIAYDKVRGMKAAIKKTVDTMEAHAIDGKNYCGKCFISHSNCLEEAEKTRDAVEERFPALKGKVMINDIGTIIASHSGPGTVAVFFLGDERTEKNP